MFIPFIYVWVPTQLIYPIRLIENKNIIESVSRSFYLIKDRWFMTFGLLILSGIVWYFVNMILSIPVSLLGGISAYKSTSGEEDKILSIIFIIYSCITSIVQYTLYGVIYVLIGIQYFNMVEEKEHPQLFKRIKEINKDNIL